MSQWQDLLRLDSAIQGRVSQLYERKFPREIRHSLCVLIESQDWDLAAVDENAASICFRALLVNLEEQWNSCVQENNILQRPDFTGMKYYLLKNFEDEPLNLAVILSECLKEEKKILASASEAQGCSSPAMDPKWKELDNKVSELERQSSEVKKEIQSLERLNDELDFIQKTWQSQVDQHIGLNHTFVEEECHKRIDFITQTKQMVLQQIVNILELAQPIVATLTDMELPEWKRRQQLACIGSPVDICLDHLQKWFTTVAEVLLRLHEQLQNLQDQNKKYGSADASSLLGRMAEIKNTTLSLFTKLLTNALVVEKQPVMSSLPQRPLILKTRVRFTVRVRFLANLPEFKYLLKVKPVFDKDVEEAKAVKGFRHFDFNRDECKVLDVDSPRGDLVTEFGHMSLKESEGRAKGSHETRLPVTEELHVIKFVTQFQYAGLELNIEASSLPVVVISSTNQAVAAWASVMWYNMLSTSEPRDLLLFVDPPPLTWQQLSQVLSWQFWSCGKRELDEDQLSVLRDKIVDDPEGLVHWNNFSKNENIWIWIDGILDLIKKHLVDLWRDGSIMGFVTRDRTQVLLQEKHHGTFLLRFSESRKHGAITFSWVDHSNGEPFVHAVDPYNKDELLLTPLPEIIYHYSLRGRRGTHTNPLIYLYPDIHKDAAFERYYNSSAMSTPKMSGYVPRTKGDFSDNPTPPPSPPRDMPMMDMDVDVTEEDDELFQELSEFFFCNSPTFDISSRNG
ncbi:signal transducer and activator of transcription 1-alpha/beta-like [Cottoperca gobio]|uniref:Signal transducer and activator of transcription n=1 Tax=Cottoperca gobio TaxID=56716 RepID=A0A6J2S0E3_COTGO|nr:signal transducer and activator of transcription 1-alpha/beta-like [Cottoperca gobio]XP_029315530.1 signal transducer and activator of transcription 1-alpha/beta-like [Cottoperca gobio]